MRDVLNHITGGAEMFAICVRDGAVPDEKLGELMTGDNLGDRLQGRRSTAATDDAKEAFAIPGAMDRDGEAAVRRDAGGDGGRTSRSSTSPPTRGTSPRRTGQSTDLDPEVLDAAYQVAQSMLNDDFGAARACSAPRCRCPTTRRCRTDSPRDSPASARPARLHGAVGHGAGRRVTRAS